MKARDFVALIGQAAVSDGRGHTRHTMRYLVTGFLHLPSPLSDTWPFVSRKAQR